MQFDFNARTFVSWKMMERKQERIKDDGGIVKVKEEEEEEEEGGCGGRKEEIRGLLPFDFV
ncbi:hypothetical protein E2C01_083024 [Portunus trituberculatus]|uniref:Uncharacterized protein n=1 Tax=Portunus trituberculatus TaxID=210409 RepID=A0A5B7IRD8_PORTR|nr:hypothetical protein [Portunus trituberculatus]